MPKKGVYIFLNEKICFKVGKAGNDSQARWNSHHYNLDKSTPSTFTKSFLKDLNNFKKYFNKEKQKELDNFASFLKEYNLEKNFKENIKLKSKEDIKELSQKLNLKTWIQKNINRIELLIPNSKFDYDLTLLEALAQFKLKPIYEGKNA